MNSSRDIPMGRRPRGIGRLTIFLTLLTGLVSGLATGVGAQAATPVDLVALGDSYSSGVGLGPVTPGCDRDTGAFGPDAAVRLLSAPYSHPACSGARIRDLWFSQLAAVQPRHTVASVTIGGNDVGFGAKLAGCWTTCGPDTMALKADIENGSQTWDDVYDLLVTTYVNIRKRMAPDGHLYVVTYPIFFSRHTSSCQGFSAIEQNAANALVTRLDDTIYWAARKAGELLPAVHGRPGHVHFVDWRTGSRVAGGYTVPPGYPDAGRRFDTFTSPDGLCNSSGRQPFLHGYVDNAPLKFVLGDLSIGNSFHPTAAGYRHAANLLASGVDDGLH